ncbi:MAG: DUF420 domain-containing protein [Balneolaceae bacterium]
MKKTLIPIVLILSTVELVSAQFFQNKQEFTRQDTLRGSITPERAWWDLTFYHLDATFNTMFLILGFREIKRRNFAKHMNYMISAFVTSSLFLVSYIIYHHFVGDTAFEGEGIIRPIYFFILISHIVLSAFVVSLVLTSFFFAFSKKFETHHKISKWTFPIWLYVSVTGVLVFILLKVFG